MTHGSLFSGIGGFDLAAQWAGIENIFQVEIDKFCQKVLAKNFPNTKKYKDIYEFDAKEYRGKIDIISGGFPCQPFSVAGKRKGTRDDRHLWPEMLRVIREIKPSWVIAENVYGLLNIEGGMVFDEVLASLGNSGYETQTFIIPACAVNAPHKRDRIWIIAHADKNRTMGNGRNRNNYNEQRDTTEEIQEQYNLKPGIEFTDSKGGDVTNTEGRESGEQAEPKRRGNISRSNFIVADAEGWRGQDNGRQMDKEGEFICYDRWDTSWIEVAARLCRMDDGIPNRVDRLKSLGNAIVPQIAYEIFNSIILSENDNEKLGL